MNNILSAKLMIQPVVGDYVLATKYEDGDPGDPWAVGYYLGQHDFHGTIRYLVGDHVGGDSFRRDGYIKIGLIDRDFGNWLMSAAKILEQSPGGTINLWSMQENTVRSQTNKKDPE